MGTTSEIIGGFQPKEMLLDSLSEKKYVRDSLRQEIMENPLFIYKLDKKTLTKYLKPENGDLKLFGEDISFWTRPKSFSLPDNMSLPSNFLQILSRKNLENSEAVKKLEKIQLVSEIVNIWAAQAMKVSGALWFKFTNDGDIINTQTDTVINILQELEEGLWTMNIKDFDSKIHSIFRQMHVAEDQEDIIGESDLDDIEELFFDNSIKGELKIVKILQAMRYEGWSGNSVGTKLLLEQQLVKKKEFIDIRNVIANPEFYKAFESGLAKNLYHYMGNKIGDIAMKQYKKISKEIDAKIVTDEQLIDVNKQRKAQGQKIETKESLKKSAKRAAIKVFSRSLLVYQKVRNDSVRGNSETTYKGLYADVSGLSENKGGFSDFIDIADNNIDTVIELGWNIALMGATMGTGIAFTMGARAIFTGRKFANAATLSQKALNITRSVAGHGTKLHRIGTLGKKLPKVQVGSVTLMEKQTLNSLVGLASLDGLTFYEGVNLASNLIHKKNISEMLDGSGNITEIGKSILFMKLLNVHFRGMAMLSSTKYAQKLGSKIPKIIGVKTVQSLAGFGLTTGAIYSIGGIIEQLFGEGWEPSVKEYFELLVLLAIFHTAQKTKILQKSKKAITKLKLIKKQNYSQNAYAF